MAALVKYKYLGMSSVVEVDYPTPQVKLDLWGGTPGSYTGLDRFGRVVNHPWVNYGVSPEEDVARIQHGYDRNSNRLWRQNDVARALNKKFDQQYTYDGLNRLTDAKTGLLNGSHVIPPGSDSTFQQKWSLDYVANWSGFKQDDDGSGTFGLEQTRSANPVNEITDIGATTGPTWATPQYDPAGNTTSFPKPADPTESFTAVYDAWNRMVRVIDNETDDIVQENAYDGRNFRIIKKTYDVGVLDETRHIYYTSRWQAIEERLGTDPDSADAAQQYVWGIRYIDDLVLRDRDTSEPPDGVLNERLYAIQDPNWNVTTIIDDSGDVQERFEYLPYGSRDAYTDSYAPSSPGLQFVAGFNGLFHDYGLGAVHNRMRLWLPLIGRYCQRDPLGLIGGVNQYAGIHAMEQGVDPFGLFRCKKADGGCVYGYDFIGPINDKDSRGPVPPGSRPKWGMRVQLIHADGTPIPGDRDAIVKYLKDAAKDRKLSVKYTVQKGASFSMADGYGKAECNYYKVLANAGDSYGETAFKACNGEEIEMYGKAVNWIGDGEWSRCVRKCLLDLEHYCAADDQPCGLNTCRLAAHSACYSGCGAAATASILSGKKVSDFPVSKEQAAAMVDLASISNDAAGVQVALDHGGFLSVGTWNE